MLPRPTPNAYLTDLDFAQDLPGSLGSLNLDGLVVHELGEDGVRAGVRHDVDPFTVPAVSRPAALPLFGTGLAIMGGPRAEAAEAS